jgi:hypothetical protein
MNKCIIFFLFLIIIITIYEFSDYFNLKFEGFSSSSGVVQNCSQMSDCKTCVQTTTGQDGKCYWCNGKCTASKDYHAGCSSDPMKCGKNPGPTPGPDPTPYDPCPKCTACPKLQMLNVNTLMTAQ